MSSTRISSNATLWETRHFSGIRSIDGSTHRITLRLKHEPTASIPRAMLCASLPPALLSPLRPCTARLGRSVPGAQTEFNCRKPQDEPQPVPDSLIHNWRRAAVGTSALTGYKPALTGLHRTPRAQTWPKPPRSSGTRVDTVASFHTRGCSRIWHWFNPVSPSYSAPVSIRVEPAQSSFSWKHSPAPSSVRTARQHTSGWWHDRLQHFKDLLGRSEFTLLILCSLRSRQADIWFMYLCLPAEPSHQIMWSNQNYFPYNYKT